MAAATTTLNARTADPLVKPILYLDQSGVGNGPFVPAHMLVDANGNAIAAANPFAVSDAENAPFAGAVAMAVGTAYAAQRSVGVACTIAGNVEFMFPDGSTLILPVAAGWQTFRFAVTEIVAAGTTATATYFNLK